MSYNLTPVYNTQAPNDVTLTKDIITGDDVSVVILGPTRDFKFVRGKVKNVSAINDLYLKAAATASAGDYDIVLAPGEQVYLNEQGPYAVYGSDFEVELTKERLV